MENQPILLYLASLSNPPVQEIRLAAEIPGKNKFEEIAQTSDNGNNQDQLTP